MPPRARLRVPEAGSLEDMVREISWAAPAQPRAEASASSLMGTEPVHQES